MVDLDAASDFMATHARLLDRRRFDVLFRDGSVDALLAALTAYRNADGGYGWGLEPDLRATESQPGGALHAFEVFEDILPSTSPDAARLCDWLESVTLPDGGLPFALPVASDAGCAPFWANADPTVSSLQITAIVAVAAWRVAPGDPGVAGHPWLRTATEYCIGAADALGDDPFAMELAFAVQLLDAASADYRAASGVIDRLRRHVPASGLVPVRGGSEGEAMRPLDFAPAPGGPARRLFSPDLIEDELRRVGDGQEQDGGWRVDFASYSPAAELDWRGHATVRALWLLRLNQML
jgi:hypothetical protein